MKLRLKKKSNKGWEVKWEVQLLGKYIDMFMLKQYLEISKQSEDTFCTHSPNKSTKKVKNKDRLI